METKIIDSSRAGLAVDVDEYVTSRYASRDWRMARFLGRLVAVLVRKGVLTGEDVLWIMERQGRDRAIYEGEVPRGSDGLRGEDATAPDADCG